MAKVSLRIYNREIENLIEQGQANEAIAHCHHILKTFPKYLEIYRLLGKAYLEAKRNADAVDIFTRVLMATPDDFVSHVGMSIIRDEEGKLDDAIWHMERAFESQPSNPAIQGELQRLYGRRDGMEPPKIRMTRGALAHMYVQGELYPQAITEIRSILAEDPQRADMQTLLAFSYFKSGLRADASEMCIALLKRYAYAFDPNRIMVELLPSTPGAAESTQVYRTRVGELDPYATFARGSVFESGEAPDASVNLERLDYKEEEPASNWSASLGLGAAPAAADEQPDWLKSGGFSEAQPAPQETPAPAATEEGIPDFLRAAGWGAATEPERPTSMFDDDPSAGNELAPAEIPDWLKAQAPVDEIAQPVQTQPNDLPDWLSGAAESQPAQTQPNDVPDWLSGAAESQPTQTQPNDVPDWLSGVGESQPMQTPPSDDLPDWLSPMDDKKTTPPPAQPAPTVESLGASAQEQDDAVAWLESLAAKHGAKPEELVTDPNKRSETPPEWVSQAQNLPPAQPAPTVESLGASAQEQDDAVAWLESLAAKHGAKPEELVTDPNKRSETPPEWVSQAQNLPPAQPAPVENAMNIGEQFFAEFEDAAATPAAPVDAAMNIGEQFFAEFEDSAKPAETLPDWMNAKEEEPALERGVIPDWLSESTGDTVDVASTEEKEDLPAWMKGAQDKEPAAQGDLSSWLSGLDDEPGLPFDSVATPSSIVSDAMMGAKQPPADEIKSADRYEEEQPAAAESLPDWLQETEETLPPEDDDAPWAHREKFEAAQQPPRPTSPSDWKPIVADEKSQPVQSAPKPQPAQKSAPKQAQSKPVRKVDAPSGAPVLEQAKAELDRGDLPQALKHYGALIKKGKHVEETIRHLSESLYRYPVEVSILQTLGDAYMRANRLKEALEAYSKAEELIR